MKDLPKNISAELLIKILPKGGNVPKAEVARRRARNKVAKASRKANR